MAPADNPPGGSQSHVAARRRRRRGIPENAVTQLTRKRATVMLVVMALGLSALVLRLTQVQALSASAYAEMGTNQRVRTIALAAERGSVFDRRGVDLAVSVNQQTVWANPRVVAHTDLGPAGYAKQLAPILKVDEAVLTDRLSRDKAAFVYLSRKVDDATAAAVKALDLAGVDFVPESKRFYPSGTLASPLLGAVGLDNQGLSGLEVTYDTMLAGKPGELVVEQDPVGRRIPQGLSRTQPSVRGEDLILTLDQSLQFELERALSDAVVGSTARGGTAIVADTRTGGILAMANIVGDGAGAARPASSAEKNRSVTDVYEPGSTNKLITMAAALEEGLVTPETRYNVPDKMQVGNHVFSDHEPHPPTSWSVNDIFLHSSNIGTIMVAQKVGKEKLDRYLREFGFGKKTGIGFPGEASGLLLDPANWYVTSMGTVPIGNGLAVSALQMLEVYVTVANGGVWKAPHIVAETVDAQGKHHKVAPRPSRRVVSEQTAQKLNGMLRNVVSQGTGINAAIPGYTVGGKTGTARKPLEGARGYSGQYVASFVGLVPMEDPRLAAVVVLDEPTPIYGGQVAAPVFSRVMQYALQLERIPPPPPDAITLGTLSMTPVPPGADAPVDPTAPATPEERPPATTATTRTAVKKPPQ